MLESWCSLSVAGTLSIYCWSQLAHDLFYLITEVYTGAQMRNTMKPLWNIFKYTSSNNDSDIKLSNYDLMRLTIELYNIKLFEHEITEQKIVKKY